MFQLCKKDQCLLQSFHVSRNSRHHKPLINLMQRVRWGVFSEQPWHSCLQGRIPRVVLHRMSGDYNPDPLIFFSPVSQTGYQYAYICVYTFCFLHYFFAPALTNSFLQDYFHQHRNMLQQFMFTFKKTTFEPFSLNIPSYGLSSSLSGYNIPGGVWLEQIKTLLSRILHLNKGDKPHKHLTSTSKSASEKSQPGKWKRMTQWGRGGLYHTAGVSKDGVTFGQKLE